MACWRLFAVALVMLAAACARTARDAGGERAAQSPPPPRTVRGRPPRGWSGPSALGLGGGGPWWARTRLALRGGAAAAVAAAADFPGDVSSAECESVNDSGAGGAQSGGAGPDEPRPSSSASEASALDTMSSGVDEAGHRVWGERKATIDEMQNLGSGREVWKGLYWANIEQKRCELSPLATQAERAAGLRPRGILWGEDCAEATMDAPPGYFRPYGDAIPLNDTWIGGLPDGSPVLLRDVCCGGGDTSLVLENCCEHSDSRECVEDYVAAYRGKKLREKHAAEGHPDAPNPYDTTGWAKPIHPGGPPEDEEFDPAKHEGYTRFLGPGGTPPPSQEEESDEYSDGKWGVDHFEVGRFVPMAKVPLHLQRFWRPGKLGRAQEAAARKMTATDGGGGGGTVGDGVGAGGGGDWSDEGDSK